VIFKVVNHVKMFIWATG